MYFSKFNQTISLCIVLGSSASLLNSGAADWVPYNSNRDNGDAGQTHPLAEPSTDLPAGGWRATSSLVKIGKVQFESTESTSAPPQVATAEAVQDETWLPVITPRRDDSDTTLEPVPQAVDPVRPEIASDVDRLLNQDAEWCATAPSHHAEDALHLKLGLPQIDPAISASFMSDLQQLVETEESTPLEHTAAVEEINTAAELSLSEAIAPTQLASEIEEIVDVPAPLSTAASTRSSFYDDLQTLLGEQTAPSNVQNRLVVQVQAGGQEYNPAASDLKTERAEFSQLFGSVSAIKLTGDSTKPPTDASEYEAPVSRAREAIALEAGELSPAYHFGPNFYVTHPPRYTHCFRHNPLYFEDPNLERCGIGFGCLTTVKSAACFYANAVALPYLVVATPPRTCMTSLGDCPTCSEFNTSAYLREWWW